MPATVSRRASNAKGLAGSPVPEWSEMGEREHFVQFYDSHAFLVDSLSGYVHAGLASGEAAIVIATPEHREGLATRLRAAGVDVDAVAASGRYVPADAAGTLAKFMVHGAPDGARFRETVSALIEPAATGRRVRIFGEMVGLLLAEGNLEGIVRLEELWEDLGSTHVFQLFCAYPIGDFAGEGFARPFDEVCVHHTRVIPAESYSQLSSADDRTRAIILLQRKAASLQSEIAERVAVESALRAVKDELETQVTDLRRLHEMSVRLTSTLDVESVLREVLDAALVVNRTSLGLLSLCDADGGGLALQVQSGFDPDVVRQIALVPPGGGACGTCYLERRRVVVGDVETDPIFAPYRKVARAAGFRACHSTPLTSRGGDIIGVLSVHFPAPYRPSERETRLMDLYARIAADAIENARLHERVQQELEERKQSLAREHVARAEAETANRMKDEFLATVSHELRTPLNAIVGWAHILQRRAVDAPTFARGVEVIERNAQVQARLIDDILDVSRVVTGNLRLSIGLVDPATVINAAIEAVRLAADAKSIRLEVVLDPSGRQVSGDPGRLQQVVWNLLSNAIKFTPSGGRVHVRLSRAGTAAEITVNDTGEGIAAEFLPFIFDRFRQADSTITRRHGGLGLGLAIVRHLVELHGGEVRAASAGIGAGATFTIRIPLAAPGERAPSPPASTCSSRSRSIPGSCSR
jgi:signal transduction histidine kinase